MANEIQDWEQKREELLTLTNLVRDGLEGWYKAGQALLEIRDRKLYLGRYDSFEDYCVTEFQESVRRCYQMMQAVTIKNEGKVEIEMSESATRALGKAPPEKRAEIVETIVERKDGKITAKAVAEAINDQPSETEPVAKTPVEQIDKFTLHMTYLLLDLERFAQEEYGYSVPITSCKSLVSQLKKQLKEARLTHDCPWCGGSPGGCQECCGTGKVTRLMAESAPEELR